MLPHEKAYFRREQGAAMPDRAGTYCSIGIYGAMGGILFASSLSICFTGSSDISAAPGTKRLILTNRLLSILSVPVSGQDAPGPSWRPQVSEALRRPTAATFRRQQDHLAQCWTESGSHRPWGPRERRMPDSRNGKTPAETTPPGGGNAIRRRHSAHQHHPVEGGA